jgi:hypothetical protein
MMMAYETDWDRKRELFREFANIGDIVTSFLLDIVSWPITPHY